jgi:hypothetical protein
MILHALKDPLIFLKRKYKEKTEMLRRITGLKTKAGFPILPL